MEAKSANFVGAVLANGIPLLFAAAGAMLIYVWVGTYLHAPLVPDRPLGHEHHVPSAPSAATAANNPSPPTSGAPATITSGVPSHVPNSTSGAGPASAAASGSFYNAAVPIPNLPGDWPGFRGPKRDNCASVGPAWSKPWPASGPTMIWQVNVGEGYAGAAVHNGRVYLLDYDQAAQADALRCFSLADGREVWRASYPVSVKRNHGMSRTIPAVTDKYVVSLGPKCNVLCADAKTGAVKWRMNLVDEYGTTVPEWYAGQCPLIEGNRVILAPAGKPLMMAVDLATGKVLWQTPNSMQWQMTHSSISPVTVDGTKMYIYCGSGGVAGINAADGKLLWQTTEWTINTATVPSPVPVGDGRLFLTGGYGAGAMMLKLSRAESGFGVRTLFRAPPEVFGSEQQTPILHDGYLYGIVSGGQLVCLDLNGKRVWESGSQYRFGLGPLVHANGTIYALSERGVMTAVDASPTGFKPLGQVKLFDGQDAWAPIAVAGSRMIVRDLTRMFCVEMGGS